MGCQNGKSFLREPLARIAILPVEKGEDGRNRLVCVYGDFVANLERGEAFEEIRIPLDRNAVLFRPVENCLSDLSCAPRDHPRSHIGTSQIAERRDPENPLGLLPLRHGDPPAQQDRLPLVAAE